MRVVSRRALARIGAVGVTAVLVAGSAVVASASTSSSVRGSAGADPSSTSGATVQNVNIGPNVGKLMSVTTSCTSTVHGSSGGTEIV